MFSVWISTWVEIDKILELCYRFIGVLLKWINDALSMFRSIKCDVLSKHNIISKKSDVLFLKLNGTKWDVFRRFICNCVIYRLFRCSICQDTFSLLHNYKCHLRIHKNEGPYVCNMCYRVSKKKDISTNLWVML